MDFQDLDDTDTFMEEERHRKEQEKECLEKEARALETEAEEAKAKAQDQVLEPADIQDERDNCEVAEANADECRDNY